MAPSGPVAGAPIASAAPTAPNANLLDKVAGFFGSLFGHH
jgi:hypothetical protein